MPTVTYSDPQRQPWIYDSHQACLQRLHPFFTMRPLVHATAQSQVRPTNLHLICEDCLKACLPAPTYPNWSQKGPKMVPKSMGGCSEPYRILLESVLRALVLWYVLGSR